jgi:hypothetical protein
VDRLAPALFALAACAACKAGAPPGADGGAPARPAIVESVLIGEPAPATPAVQIDLVDAGAEPRRLLRYHPAAGTRQRGTIRSAQTQDVLAAGRRLGTQKFPGTEVDFELVVDSSVGGRLLGLLRLDRIRSDEPHSRLLGEPGDLERAVAGLRVTPIRLELDDRGIADTTALELPENLRDVRDLMNALVQGAASAAIPLPAEPVGEGSVWRERSHDPIRFGVAGTIVTEYRLRRSSGERLEVDIAIQMPTESQTLNMSPQQIFAYSGGGSKAAGTALVALDRMLPVSIELAIDVLMEGSYFTHEELPLSVIGKGRIALQSR